MTDDADPKLGTPVEGIIVDHRERAVKLAIEAQKDYRCEGWKLVRDADLIYKYLTTGATPDEDGKSSDGSAFQRSGRKPT